MSTRASEAPTSILLQEALEMARLQAREQLAAAWQIHVSRVEQELQSGWGQHLERLLDERFAELTARLETRVEQSIAVQVEQEVARARHTAVRALTEMLNQAARRLRQATRQEEWVSAVLDAASSMAERLAVFTVQGTSLRLEKASFEVPTLDVPLDDAPAFSGVVDSMDPIVAAATPSELSAPVVLALGPATSDRVFLFPLITRGRVVAVLYAEANPDLVDVSALELVASMAASVWELRSAERSQTALIAIQGPAPLAAPAHFAPVWADLSAEEQELHLRAQRFARVQVAEIRLYQSPAVKQGRARQSVYLLLKDAIDSAREAYREQFLKDCPSMVDYFHVEMVRTLANDDATLLGTDYPGPLV